MPRFPRMLLTAALLGVACCVSAGLTAPLCLRSLHAATASEIENELAELHIAIADAQASGSVTLAKALAQEYSSKLSKAQALDIKTSAISEIVRRKAALGKEAAAKETRSRESTQNAERKFQPYKIEHDFRGRGEIWLSNGSQWSADGKYILTILRDRVIVWQSQTGSIYLELPKISDGMPAVFSYDGQKLLTVSEDLELEIWDLKTKMKVAEIPVGSANQKTSVADAVISRDGRFVAAVGFEGENLSIWDAKTGTLKHQLKNISQRFAPVLEFSPDARTLLTVADEGAILWDVETGTQLHHFPGRKPRQRPDPYLQSQFSPDSRKIALLEENQYGLTTASVWDVDSYEKQYEINDIDDLESIAFNRNGSKLLLIGNSASIHNSVTGVRMRDFQYPKAHLSSAAFSPDGSTILVTTNDGTSGRVSVYDLMAGIELESIPLQLLRDGMPLSAMREPMGNRILTFTNRGTTVWVQLRN